MQILYGARCFDGRMIHDDAALVVADGRVEALVPYRERPVWGDHLDLGGGLLSPGLIDVQINGGAGVLFNATPDVEALRTIAAAHRRGGTTHFLPTVITDRPEILARALDAAAEAIGVVPGVLGIHVEGPFIDPKRAGAHPREWIRPMRPEDADFLIARKTAAMLVTLAPIAAEHKLIARLAAAGIIVSLGHSEATDAEAMAAFRAGARGVTHLFNAMSQLGNRAAGLVGAALAEPDVICGLIADGAHVAATSLKVALRAKGPEDLALVSDAMPPSAGGPARFDLQGRSVRRVGNHLELEDGTLAGAAITLLDGVRHLVEALGVPLADALRMATSTPARLLGIDGRYGQLGKGHSADLLHLGDDLAVHATFLAGRLDQS
jgi:N-acetylglucosamine-6-phosphate deacetylase